MLDSTDAISAPRPVRRGTPRRTERSTIRKGVALQLDGTPAALIDLSPVGAQALSATILKPGQRVRMSVADKETSLRFVATIVWAWYEGPGGRGITGYRVGLHFVNADREGITAFCTRNLRVPDPLELVAPPMPRVAAETAPRRVPRAQVQEQRRRAERLAVHEGVKVRFERSPAMLVDLSTTGAQVLSPTRVRPGQRVLMSMTYGRTALRVAASVVWASLALSRGDGITGHRAGVTFLYADRERVTAFFMRNRKTTNAPPLAESTPTTAAPPDTPIESPITPDAPPPVPGDPQAVPAESPPTPDADATTAKAGPKKTAARRPKATRAEAPKNTRQRPPATTDPLRDLPEGTPIVIMTEQVVSLVKVKRSRFLAEAPDGRTLDLPLTRFVRVHSD